MFRLKVLLIVILFFLTNNNALATDHYRIVIHPDVKQETISTNVLRAIFSMRLKTWSDGRLIKVYVLPDEHELHQDFSKETINVFPYQLRATWDRLVFSGTGQAPTTLSSSEEMLHRIANTPGAIGYLKTTVINDDVHVIQIK